MSDFPIKPTGVEFPVQGEVARPTTTKSEGFADTLKQALHEVNELQSRSSEEIGEVLRGDVKDVHDAMLALQKADLSFQLMLQVRNKLVQAYREIMRMQ